MSIERDGSAYILVCDACGESDYMRYYDWDDAVEGKKDRYLSRCVNGDWQDICRDCQALWQRPGKTVAERG